MKAASNTTDGGHRTHCKTKATGTAHIVFEDALERLPEFVEAASQQWDGVLYPAIAMNQLAGSMIMPCYGRL